MTPDPSEIAAVGAKYRYSSTPLTIILRYHLLDCGVPRSKDLNLQVSPGNTYGYVPYNTSVASELYSFVYESGGCVDQLQNCVATGTNSICSAADSFCLRYVENFYDAFTGRDEDDIRQLAPDP